MTASLSRYETLNDRQITAWELERFRSRLEAKSVPFIEVETPVCCEKDDPLARVVGMVRVHGNFGQFFPTLWCVSDPAKLRGGQLYERIADLVEDKGSDKLIGAQRKAIKSQVEEFITARDPGGQKNLIEVSIVDFGYGTTSIAAPIAKGSDSFVHGKVVAFKAASKIRVRTFPLPGIPQINIDPRDWVVARGDGDISFGKSLAFTLAPTRRVTQWFGGLVNSYEQRLHLIDRDESRAVEARWFKFDSLNGVRTSLGSEEVRIRCVRYQILNMPEKLVNVHRMEIRLIPDQFALSKIVTRFSDLSCYATTLPGVKNMIANVASL